jgi:catechol 2,3-dioxygenase-like lactoylglutathione lyase family enzyme
MQENTSVTTRAQLARDFFNNKLGLDEDEDRELDRLMDLYHIRKSRQRGQVYYAPVGHIGIAYG